MIQTEVIIVGAGPSGSACAWRLKQSGVDCLLIDQQRFPRVKTCAGWITPAVLKDLRFSHSDYPHGLTQFNALHIAVGGMNFKLRTRQYAIRRVEFDHWQMERSGAPLHVHSVKNIEENPDGFVIDGEFSARYLVGAGGTYCPVYRTLFKDDTPKDRGQLIAAQEEEFAYPYTDPECRLWFLENKLPGYSWYVPKANGIVNVGVGGKAEDMNANGDSLKRHWNALVEKLERLGLVCQHTYKPSAHTYFLRQRRGAIRRGNAFLVGDSAGLATLDMGEGISASIKSGLLAAEAILSGGSYTLAGIPKYSLFPGVVLESIFWPFMRK